MAKLSAKHGYDCELVTPPNEDVETHCPVCHLIMREPCLIDCPCSKHFCRECIERVRKDKKPCPLCNKSGISFIRHHTLERKLAELEVWCCHKEEGCEWKGKLAEYEEHLNEDPPSEEELNGCPFVKVKCVHKCEEMFHRRSIHTHQTEHCPQRPFYCRYCNKYEASYKKVVDIHYPKCKKYPVTCPNRCREDPFERQKVEKHVKNDCPLTEVNCSFDYAGCEVKLPRRDIPEHMKDVTAHLQMLSTTTRSLLKEVETLKIETYEVKATLAGFPIDFQVNMLDSKEVNLPPFYTHPHGYRMCIRICPAGDKEGKGTHLSVYTHLMKGSYDRHLKWPFKGRIKLRVINQMEDTDHIEKTITYDARTPSGEMNMLNMQEITCDGWGISQFSTLYHIRHTCGTHRYVENDHILIRIVDISR